MPRVATRDGYSLYAEAHGEGIPLVLSCALCTTHENWRPQVPALVGAGARVVLWDYRGHGRSSAPLHSSLAGGVGGSTQAERPTTGFGNAPSRRATVTRSK